MKKYFTFLVLFLLCLEKAFSLSISPQDANKIGDHQTLFDFMNPLPNLDGIGDNSL